MRLDTKYFSPPPKYFSRGEARPENFTQVVRYTADENGYRADVSYEGEAQYPPPHYYG